jgi:superkiller protein 3
VAQAAVHAAPARPESRREIASLLMQQGEFRPALAVSPPGSSEAESVGLRAVAASLVQDADAWESETALRQAQRAIMLSPSQPRVWQMLAFVRARRVQ